MEELESARNPFAAVVLAHLKSLQTRQDPGQRRDWKVRLVKSLFERGLSAEEIRQFFRLIDWLMDLPRELETEFWEEIQRFEEERQMPYVTSIERIALERGLEQGEVRGLRRGIELGLELKFGEAGLQLLPLVRAVERLDVLQAVQESIRTAPNADEIRDLLEAGAPDGKGNGRGSDREGPDQTPDESGD